MVYIFVWVTASLLKSPGLFEFSRHAVVLMVSIHFSWGPFQADYVQLASPSSLCSTAFFSSLYLSIFSLSFIFTLWSALYLSIFSLSFIFTLWSAGRAKYTRRILLLASFYSSSDSKSPQISRTHLFSVFHLISTMLQSKWSRFFLRFLSPTILFPSLWGLFQAHHQQLLSPSLTYSTVYFLDSPASSNIFLTFLFHLLCGRPERQNLLDGEFLFIITQRWVSNIGIGWSVCISKFQIIFSVSFSRTDTRLCIQHGHFIFYLFAFFYFHSVVRRNGKIRWQVLFFLLIISMSPDRD